MTEVLYGNLDRLSIEVLGKRVTLHDISSPSSRNGRSEVRSADDAPAAVAHFAGRTLDDLRLAIDPDRVLEVAAHAIFVIAIGTPRPEAPAMAALGIVPIGLTAGSEGAVCSVISALTVIVVEVAANRAPDHGA